MVSGICLGGRIQPRDLPLWQTTVASGAPGTPLLAEKGRQSQLGVFSGPFALATGVAGKAGGLGKWPSMVAALILLVSSLRVSLAAAAQRLLLTGSQRRTFRCVSRPVGVVEPAVALCWSLRNLGGGGGAPLEAARVLQSAVSRRVVGKIAAAGGRGECRRRDSSSAGTVDRTSARSESRWERSRLASAGTAWLPTKARGGEPRGIPRRWKATSLSKILSHRF